MTKNEQYAVMHLPSRAWPMTAFRLQAQRSIPKICDTLLDVEVTWRFPQTKVVEYTGI